MKQILVIAKDMRAAREEARYQAAKIAQPSEWLRVSSDQIRLTKGLHESSEQRVQIFWAPPSLATQQMVGLRLDEIIIIGDWVGWDFGPPGAFSNFAGMMAIQMAHGATRRWER